jgi:hypothetical protein
MHFILKCLPLKALNLRFLIICVSFLRLTLPIAKAQNPPSRASNNNVITTTPNPAMGQGLEQKVVPSAANTESNALISNPTDSLAKKQASNPFTSLPIAKKTNKASSSSSSSSNSGMTNRTTKGYTKTDSAKASARASLKKTRKKLVKK